MKKTAILLLAALLFSLLFSGCARSGAGEEGRLRIVATTFPPYDFARAVAGELCSVTMLLPPGTETHSYDPTPQDIRTIRDCDVFIYGGGESDTWMDGILASMDTSRIRILRMTELVPLLEEEDPEGEEHGEHESEYDEHVWTSPANAAAITEAICAAVSEADPENAASYRASADAYIAQIDALGRDFAALTASAARRCIVFADRFPFLYFVRAFGLSYAAAFPGCAEETEPGAQTVSRLIEKVETEKIPVVFYTEFSNQKLADVICEKTGAQKLRFHSCHNVSRADFDAGVTYVSLMRENLENLRKALN